jgi:hypothetical protein
MTLDQIHTRTVAARRTTMNAHSSGEPKKKEEKQPIACEL